MFGYELKKLFIKQYAAAALLVLTLLQIIFLSFVYKDMKFDNETTKKHYYEYMDKLEGRLDSEKTAFILSEQESILNAKAELKSLQDAVYQGQITNKNEYTEKNLKIQSVLSKSSAFERIYSMYKYVGASPQNRYFLSYGKFGMCRDYPDIAVLIFLVAYAANFFLCEESSQMITLIKVCENRSKNTFISKIAAFGILIILTQFLISLCEYFFMQESIGKEGLGYPIQCLEYFGGCEYNITILKAFIFIGVLKAIGYIFLFSLIAFLSTVCKKAVISVSVPLVICLIQQFVFSDKSMGYYISTGLLRAVGFFRGDAYETKIYYGNEVSEKVFSAVSKSAMIWVIIISLAFSLVFLTAGCVYYKGYRKKRKLLVAVLPLILLLNGCGQNSGNELFDTYYNLKWSNSFVQNDKNYYCFNNEREVVVADKGDNSSFAAVREPFDSKLWVDNFCIADNKMYLFQYVFLNSFSLYELDLDTYHIEEICGQRGEPDYSFLGLRFDSNVIFDKTVLYAFTNGERLFLVTSDSEVYECGMNLYGSECIISDGIYGNNLIYNGKEIYYINNKLELVRYDVNKKNRIILPMNFVRAFDVDNEKIIYSSNDGIYTYDIIDKTEKKLSELTSDNILIDGSNVVFSSKNMLYLYDADKNECREIYDEGFVDFSIIKGENSILCTKYLPKDECFEKIILNY